MVNNLPAAVGDPKDLGSIPGLGRSPGEGNDNPLQYSCLENPMDRGAWQATVHGIAETQTGLNPHACIFIYVCVSILFACILHLILSIKNNGMTYKYIQNYQLLLPLMVSVRPA